MVYCSTRLALSGLISLFCSNLFSQTATFQQTYGGAGYDVANDMLETADGYLIAGETFNPTNDHTDALLIKLDKNGTVIWKKTYGQFADDGFRDIAPANDGGFIVWGALENFNLNRTDAWLVKLDDDGNLLWQKTIGETGFSEYPTGRIIALPDGYILSGSKVNPGYYQPFVLRVNNAGNTLWSQFTPSNNYSSMHAHYVVDSMLYLSGTANSLGAWRTMNISTGEIVQHREYLADSTNWWYNMHRTPEGNHILTGNITKDIPGLIRYYGWVQKVGPQGQVIWSKIYNAGEVSNITASEMLADGSCVLGLYFQPSTQVGIIHSALVKIDTAGAVVWARTFTGTPWLFINDITQTTDGGFFATGYTQNISGPTINQNAIWIKTDSLGIVDGCCVATPTIVVEDIPVTPGQEQINEATFEQTVPFQFAFADTAILQVLDFCSNVQPEISQTIQFCPGESVTLGDSTYNLPVTVTLNLPSVTGGCDTIATYTLEYKTGNACIDSTCEASFFKRFFVPGKSTLGYKIVPAPNETFFVAASADENTIIALTDKNMNVIWARSVDLAGGPDAIQDMRLDAEGNIIGVGNTLTFPINCFAFKMDPATGQLLWRSQQNSPINSYFTKILEKNSDGSDNYFLFGQTDAASGGTGCDALLMEIDRNTGAMVWDKHYHLGSCEIFNDMFIENNLIYTCGRYNLYGGGQAGFRAALSLLDMNGNVQWSRHYLRSDSVDARLYASEMVQDNGGIVLFGYGDDAGTNLSASTLQLMKTSPTGELIWAKEYDIAGGTDQIANKILNFPDGYLLCGTFVRAATSGREMYLIKTDKNGNVLWQRSYGINGEDRLRDIIRVSDKLFLIGSSQNGQIFDMLIGKLFLDGTVDIDGPCIYVKPLMSKVMDYTPYFSTHTLATIDVTHNYALASLPNTTPESLSTEAICLKLCPESCSGKPDATVFIDSIYCNDGRIEVRLRICNAGPAPLPVNTPIALYDANPTTGNANLLLTVLSSAVVDSGACQTIVIPDISSALPGAGSLTLAVVANDDGSHQTPFPIDSLHNTGIEECDYSNNLAVGEFVKPPSALLLTCPKDTVVIAPGGITAVPVAYNLPNGVSDCVCPGVNIDLESGGAGGDLFPLGLSTVCYRAEDACGSEKTCCFTIRVDRESVCDTKINGCLKFELVSVNRDAGQNWVYRIRITNNCNAEMTFAYIQLPAGVEAMAPANNSQYTAPGGLEYTVRNPSFSPFYSIRFKSAAAGLVNGQSDIFRYVLPAQTKPDYIHVAARLLSGVYVEAHLNTFYCPVGTEPANKPGAGERGAAGFAPALQVFPNPATEGTTLTIAGGKFPDGVFVLQDLAGRLVMERRIVDNRVLPAPSGLSTGMYYFKIMENGRFAGSGKLIVQD